jgi:hypothetical protein
MMRHYFIVFCAAETMVAPAIMCLATPTSGAVVWVVDWQTELPQHPIHECPIDDAMSRDAADH